MIKSKDYIILATLRSILEIIIDNRSFGCEHTRKAQENLEIIKDLMKEELDG